jgi:hypothetical protein
VEKKTQGDSRGCFLRMGGCEKKLDGLLSGEGDIKSSSFLTSLLHTDYSFYLTTLTCLALLFAFLDEFIYSPSLLFTRVSDGLIRGISILLQITSLLGGGRLPEVIQLLAFLFLALFPFFSESQIERSLVLEMMEGDFSVKQHNHVLQSHAHLIQSYAPILINAFHFTSSSVKRLTLQWLTICVWAFRTHTLTLPHCKILHTDTFNKLYENGSEETIVMKEVEKNNNIDKIFTKPPAANTWISPLPLSLLLLTPPPIGTNCFLLMIRVIHV